MSRPSILIVNDDGIIAPGIRALVEAMQTLGDVTIVAPDSPQSGQGHAITINNVLRLEKVHWFEGLDAYQCSGTPVDCVKIAIDKVLHKKPDICVSGINHGSNASLNILYSGTMSAAMEAAIEGIPAIGFSLLDYAFDADFTAAKSYAQTITQQVLTSGLPEKCLLNVNIPALPLQDIKGIKICRQAVAKWEEEFFERQDPMGKKYYWLTGKFVNHDEGVDSDIWALENGYVSVVPVQFDLTHHKAIQVLNQQWNIV